MGKEGVLTPLLKEFLEEAMEGELDAHLEEDDRPNRKNGKGKKTVKTPVGSVDISTLRDRNGTFEPELVPERHKTLGAVYPFVWLDAIHYKVRHEGLVVNRAVYCIIGLNQDGYKELLGLYIGDSEGTKFWLQVLTDLQN